MTQQGAGWRPGRVRLYPDTPRRRVQVLAEPCPVSTQTASCSLFII